ncbi:MAG: argininosuccinate synthase [Euryarchaeota archaeon]|nr:argininosuccinate synthase [Euryarchaeota archaeon]
MLMKAVLAYSGGLDTSVCVKLLQEKYGCEVVTVTVDVGLARGELREVEEKARSLGVVEHYTIDAREEFARKYIFRAIKANASYQGYPLSTALARPLIAEKVVEVAERENAEALAHGATGKGNDQFRFEAVFRALAPDKRIIAPIRELNLTRKESIAYAKKHGIAVPVDVEKPYSIDENLWGRSIEGGSLEDPAFVPPEEIYEWTRLRRHEPELIEVEFSRGEPVKLNGRALEPVELIVEANRLAGEHGVGRIDMIEDRILGLKARENYECPAAELLITAHRALEALVLTRRELAFKAQVEARWSELVYFGLWNEPLRLALDAFIDRTQERVSGRVKLRLHQGSCRVVARESENALYSLEAVSFDDKSLDQRSVEGMLRYHALQAEMYWRTLRRR